MDIEEVDNFPISEPSIGDFIRDEIPNKGDSTMIQLFRDRIYTVTNHGEFPYED